MNKTRSAHILLIISIVVIVGMSKYSVLPNQPPKISIDELRQRPDRYHGQFIKTSGVMVSGFEAGAALSDTTIERGGAKYLKEPAIYLHNATVKNQRDCFSTGLPPITFCTVDVEGVFEYGRSYGHASFRSQFQIRGLTRSSTEGPVTPASPAEQKDSLTEPDQ